MAYQYFGDVVTFDTTYRTNKYDMPFAPFTGVNHHFQSIQFGCALLQDETEVTFTWLFETWLEAMGGRHPISIITDQDLAMKSAIAKVFPNSRHRLCFWHIKKKFVEKLSHLYYKKSKFKNEIKNVLHNTYKVEQFEIQWEKMIIENDLKNNSWLRELYKERELWVPVYNRNTFFAGTNTTGHSEGVNAFFDEFVTSTTNLREFVVKYEQALNKIIRRENDEDFETEHKFRIVDEGQFLLKHVSKVYTRNIFNKFKKEWTESFMFKLEDGETSDGNSTFHVINKIGKEQHFVVTLNLQTLKGSCECKNFEFIGILCRHILKVFCKYDIDEIPDHFILSRWKQGANKFRTIDGGELMKIETDGESDVMRLSYLCQEASKVACIASESKKCSVIFTEGLNKILKEIEQAKLEEVQKNGKNVTQEKLDSLLETEKTCAVSGLLLDPHISITKGRKKTTGRIKSGIEISVEKKKRKCKGCSQSGHDWRVCPLNPKNSSKVGDTARTKRKLEEYDDDDDDDYDEEDDDE